MSDRFSRGAACGLPAETRRHRGLAGYHNGQAAEEIVSRDYLRRGCTEVRRRWRGPAGEIDLIVEDGETVIFVEVKAATTHDIAASRLSAAQLGRIRLSADCYLGQLPRGSLTDCRIDLALVDGQGRVAVIENIGQF